MQAILPICVSFGCLFFTKKRHGYFDSISIIRIVRPRLGQAMDEISKEVFDMEKKQTIGCDVTSCVYNHEGVKCDLDHIEVSCCGESCGRENESLCASYRCESENE